MKLPEKLSGYMPSKNFALVFSAFLVAGLVVFTAFKVVPQIKQKNEIAQKQEQFVSNVLKDTDNDGLKDWEEVLWHTDPNNPDTDGDGTPDGEEVKLGRNPLVAGPNDQLTKEDVAKVTGNQEFLNLDANQTDLVSAGIFNKYAEAKKASGGLVPDSTLKDIASTFTAEAIKNATSSATALDNKNIKISTKNDPASIKNYANKMGAIIIDFATKKMDLKNQTQAQNLTEDQASEIIVAITQQEGIYAEAEEKIKNVLVPSSYADIHLAILNSFNRIVVASIEAEKVNDDPVKALANVKIIKDEMPVWGANLSDLATKLISDNISFNNDEPGGAIIMFQQALQQ